MTQTPDSTIDASSVSPPSSAAPPVATEVPESAPSLMDYVRDYAAMFDTSQPDSVPEPGWKARQRQVAMRERPIVKQETVTSRKQRRAQGDYRRLRDSGSR